jgi:hypothetical protein
VREQSSCSSAQSWFDMFRTSKEMEHSSWSAYHELGSPNPFMRSGDALLRQNDSLLEYISVGSIGIRHGSIKWSILMLEMNMACVRTELGSPIAASEGELQSSERWSVSANVFSILVPVGRSVRHQFGSREARRSQLYELVMSSV